MLLEKETDLIYFKTSIIACVKLSQNVFLREILEETRIICLFKNLAKADKQFQEENIFAIIVSRKYKGKYVFKCNINVTAPNWDGIMVKMHIL